ncbi:hypothetical protein TNIN_304941 [Trichonephila inaurata madagascariensis]|uniref:Uncharacterized protein n=1 Tax=Trichonephila inaurata madagascariensis TaxID=2747483 RepID=A0A8X6ITM3_9ARAC|nr:hypothetical protein TNIN_304941 [Trichonephila inaurata madagascariensis]
MIRDKLFFFRVIGKAFNLVKDAILATETLEGGNSDSGSRVTPGSQLRRRSLNLIMERVGAFFYQTILLNTFERIGLRIRYRNAGW